MNNFNNKGKSMPLPFLAGIAAGAIAVIAWNKKDLLAQKLQKGAEQTCQSLSELASKGKALANTSLNSEAKELKTQASKAETQNKAKPRRHRPSQSKSKSAQTQGE